MLRCFLLTIALLLSLTEGWAPSSAQGVDGAVKREILALFDGSEEAAASKTRIHKFAEMPLNYLGFSVVYRDVRSGLPATEEVTRYAAVLTWFEDVLPNRYEYLKWAISAARSGLKYIILDSVGADPSTSDLALINQLLGILGLKHSGKFVEESYGTRASVINRNLYEFELPLGSVFPPYPIIAAQSSSVVPLLTVQTPGRADDQSQESILAAIGPGGGYVSSNYAFRYDRDSDRLGWLINPFGFFKQSLHADPFPVPDVTTVSGNRLYFSHMDGDGFRNTSIVEAHRGEFAGQVLLSELIAPFPDLPVTVGIIAGDVSTELGGDAKVAQIAKKIFEQPQVEVGCHTATLPFTWGFFENYDRAKEDAFVDKLKGNAIERAFKMIASQIWFDRKKALIAGWADLPRAYYSSPFDLGIEVHKAVEITNDLAPKNKRVTVYQWSGDAEPFEAAVHQTRDEKLMNINGGDTRFDQNFPSVAYVSPIARQVGRERQVYAVDSNENTYTNHWAGPYYGFRNLLETVRNTDYPRRLKGFNVHYQAFSAERLASLDAVKSILDSARTMDLTPLTTSHYAAIADGFFSTRIAALKDNRWLVSERGALNTVRFDDAEALAVDFDRSRGVMGEARHAGSLYVALDAKIEEAIVAVRDRHPWDNETLKRPVLSQGRWLIENLSYQSVCNFSYDAQGFGGGFHVWRVGQQDHYLLMATRDNRLVWSGQAESSPDGTLKIDFPNIAIEPVHIQVQCAGPQAK